MATTTNYGWTTPDDTALVKDGASAIRTLGSSVDTTTKNLNPSTTLGDLEFRSSTANVNTRLPIGSSGQHLTVVAGVPAWATASDQTPLTTKGDLFTFSTLDTRIGVGANNTVLTADSAEATGLKWATPPAGGMTLISTTTLTGSSVTISSIPGTYKNLVLQFRNVRAGSDGGIRVRVNGDSGTRYRTYGDAGNNLGGASFNATEWTSEYGGNSSNDSSSANWIIYDYAYTTTYKIGECFNWFVGYNNTANSDSTKRYFGYNQTAAITSLDLFSNIGNWSNGTVLLYGVS